MAASKAAGTDSTSPESVPDHTAEKDARDHTAERMARKNVRGLSPEQEVAARTADTDEDASKRFVKVFTVLKAVPLTDEMHDANRVNVVREMINRGMRAPTESAEVRYDGSEDAPDGESVYLRYSVSAFPAGRLPEDTPANRVQVKPAAQPDDPGI